MPLEELMIEGYEAFKSEIQTLEKDKAKSPLVILFTGSEGDDGKSWCPDCVALETKLEKFQEKYKPEGCLVRVKVGARDEWKSKTSPFRTDPKLKLTSIPTLMLWGKQYRRLSEDAVLNMDSVALLFEDE